MDLFQQKAAMLPLYLLAFAGESVWMIMPVLLHEGMFLLLPVAMIHTYHCLSRLSFPLYVLKATVQAYSQLLPGSCNFESNTCGYTSDADFTSWNLHKDGTAEHLQSSKFEGIFILESCIKCRLSFSSLWLFEELQA